MLTWGSLSGSPSTNLDGPMKHYIILKPCNAGGERRNAGDVVELTDSEGNALTNMGRVAQADAPKVAPKKAAPKKSTRAVKLKGSDTVAVETPEDGDTDSK